MARKVLVGALVAILVVGIGGFFWVRSVFTQDTVRVALAEQLTRQLGQPVKVGRIAATVYPRITVTLGNVTIGEPVKIHVRALDVGTDFRALLSRRIEHASMHLNGARIELPLPEFAFASAHSSETAEPAEPGELPVKIVSIDEIVLSGVEVVSGGRTLTGNIELVPQGAGVTIRKIALSADDTTIDATGRITDLTGPTGELTIKAGTLNMDRLLAFANDFSAGSTAALQNPANPVNPMSSMNLTVSLEADRATMGAMAIEKLTGRATIKGQEVALDPLAFNLFGGRYEGTMGVTLGPGTPTFRWRAAISNIDVAAATAFAGSPNTVSGTLAAKIELSGSGADASTAMKTVAGTARIDVANGVVKNLGLIRTVVAATSLNAGAVASAAGGSRDERFSRLGGTISVANGTATTNDLRFESDDLTLTAAGTAQLDASALNFKGQVQLSEELSKQTSTSSVLRATNEGGRMTLPASISGSAASPQVRIDTGDMAKRALRNTANEQGKKAVEKGLKSLLSR
jgi:uncharacterized protein involved in outer membrane biogenesis